MATQSGYLVLADISGYTAYLAGVELDHAHEILTDLLETIIARFKPLLTISKLEGDAVFAYASLTRGEMLLDLVETTYVAFCDRRDSSHRRTTCECRACQGMPSLDLKFFLHHGDFVVQNIAGISELVGSDVNLVHRLTKNHLFETTGWKAYAMFTETGLQKLGLALPEMHRQAEAYEHLGEVQTLSFDLRARREALLEARRVTIDPQTADYIVSLEYAAPPPVVWEWLTDLSKRDLWVHGVKWRAGERPEGRMGAGARNHCEHGKTVSTETVIDWRPFEYYTARTEDAESCIVETFYLEPVGDGSRTRVRDVIKFEKIPLPLPRPLAVPVMRFVMKNVMKYEVMLDRAGAMIAADQARRREEQDDPS